MKDSQFVNTKMQVSVQAKLNLPFLQENRSQRKYNLEYCSKIHCSLARHYRFKKSEEHTIHSCELTSTISENCFWRVFFSATFSQTALMQGTVLGEQTVESLEENELK